MEKIISETALMGLTNVIKVNDKVLYEILAKQAEFIQKVVWDIVVRIEK
ncbi:hypothetical protein SDC9_200052 [bioreactor metagenome]|uniref:Uncharacterized protein n=1 Tax=bioreactor metagenome TaxID=1076179 RepID=A0A645IM65_9ZZZZ